MAESFADRLVMAVLNKKSQVCVGLDPKVDSLPEGLIERHENESQKGCGCRAVASCFEEFCGSIIESVAPHAVAVKLQLACFEQYGPPGMRAFKHLCGRAADEGLLVIADAKRGDIGISAAAYSAAYIGKPSGSKGGKSGFKADAMTVNPFFGSDGIGPFVEDCDRHGKGIFVLVKTSNPSSSELQDLVLDDGSLFYEKLASLVSQWGAGLVGSEGYSSVGIVAGATQAQALVKLRQVLPHAFFLLPGLGAQGGRAADVAPVFDSKGLGGLAAASRSIIYAGSGDDYAEAAAGAAEKMKLELWEATRS